MSDLFDAATSRRLRDQGMAIAASYPNDEWLAKAQATAQMLAAQFGETNVDEVLKLCPRPDHIHPNTTGSIFAGAIKRDHMASSFADQALAL